MIRASLNVLSRAASILLATLALPAAAAPGDLDASFGTGGKVTTSFGTGKASDATGLVLQGDGKIVVAGTVDLGGADDLFTNFAVARYLADGSLDAGFGSGGVVTTDFGQTRDSANGVAMQGDGKLIVVGHRFASAGSMGVARYLSDGSLDPAFGTGGKVATSVGAVNSGAQSVAVQSDGRIVVAGWSVVGGGDVNFAVVRYLTDGTPDPAFGSGGIVTTSLSSGDDTAYSVAVQSDGRIVVAGTASNGSDPDFAVVRYNSDGTLDSTFGAGGKVITPVGSSADMARSVAVQSDGKLVIAGQVNGSNSGFALVRYQASGSLDPGFGIGGKVITPVGSGSAPAYSAAVQTDGKVVVVGNSVGGNSDIAVVRYGSDGTLDPGFGSGGKVITPIGSGDESGRGVAVQSDGKIVVAGFSHDGSKNDFAVVRYLGAVSAPVVTTGAASSLGKTSATVAGAVHPSGGATMAKFEYGTSVSYGSVSAEQTVNVGAGSVNVQAGLTGLLPNTTYHYRITATNEAGTSMGADATFTTFVDPPIVATGSPAGVSETGATLQGALNPNGFATDVSFQWGQTVLYGNTTPVQTVPAGGSVVDVSAVLTGLAAGVTYHYRIVATNTGGTATGDDVSFVATSGGGGGGGATAAPAVTTSAAVGVTPRTATLQGSVNANGGTTLAQFEYGLTTSYGSSTTAQGVGNGSTPVTVSMPTTGLLPGSMYHYRLVASNSLGTSSGADMTFTTPFEPPAVVTGTALAGSTFATLGGTVNPNGTGTTAYFEYGADTNYGTQIFVAGPLSGSGVLNVQAALAAGALAPNTAYHYRLVATNSGGVTPGADATFTTTGSLPPTAADDVIFTTRLRDGNGSIDVLANDKDPDTDTRTGLVLDGVSNQQFPTRGTIVQNSNGTVTYKAFNGFDPEGDSFTYTVKKQNAPALTAQATVRVLSFVPFEGFDADVFRAAAGGTVPTGGALTCKLTKLGAGTLTLDWLGKKYNDKVVFDATGRAVTDVPKIGFPAGTVLHLDLQLDATGGNNVINVTLTDHQAPTDAGVKYVATLLSAGTGGSDVVAGVHNGFFDLGPSGSSASAPERGLSAATNGFGFNIASISKSKRGRFIGRVPDFEKYSKGSVVPTRNRYVVNPGLYRLQRALRGALLGQVDLKGVSFASDFQWRRDDVPGVFTGFDRRLILGGELYRASNETPADVALRIFGGDGRAQVRFEGGGLASPKVALIQVTLASVLRRDGFLKESGGMPNLKFRMQSNVGRYSGSFTHPDTGSKTKFEGILRRRSDSLDPRKGAGAFKSEDGNTGTVTVLPLGT